MIKRSYVLFISLLAAALLMIGGCTQKTEPAEGTNNTGQLSGAFDPENQKEYGLLGIYLGQGIKEAMDVLKPTKYEFMDTVSRESLTVDQLAAGRETMATGILLKDHAQLMLKVKNGMVQSILMGGVPEQEAQNYKTNRGLAVYDSVDQLKKLYGETAEGKEMVYKGSKYQALFSINQGKVIGYRFDPVE